MFHAHFFLAGLITLTFRLRAACPELDGCLGAMVRCVTVGVCDCPLLIQVFDTVLL